MIDDRRINVLADRDIRSGGDYVLYWMQASQRARYNHALEYAVRQANDLDRPVVVVFALAEDYPEANARHFTFMLEGLAETRRELADRGIQLVVRRQSPPTAALELADRACLVVADRGYLRHQVDWRSDVADGTDRRVVEVESDVVVPVDTTSDKEEYAARTIRPKINRLREEFLTELHRGPLRRDSTSLRLGGIDVRDPAAVLETLDVDRSVGPVGAFRGGAAEAERLLERFVPRRLKRYPEDRSDPDGDAESHMSPYLHFGQISPVRIALKVLRTSGASQEAKEAYLEELIVRRELSINFVQHNPRYDEPGGLPDWARATLRRHRGDDRPARYDRETLDRGETDDPYWNAAQRQMVVTGKMHNYMRMYWGKKLLEWHDDPADAFRVALEMNNRYELDGRDPNSYAGVAWCFGKHDRPWAERDIFGTVRYMSASGLERKFDMDAWIERVRETTRDG